MAAFRAGQGSKRIESNVAHTNAVSLIVQDASADNCTDFGADTAPKPNSVRYNDWRQVEIPPLEEFEPRMPVSVVVPYFEAPRELDRTLAALERQTYPPPPGAWFIRKTADSA